MTIISFNKIIVESGKSKLLPYGSKNPHDFSERLSISQVILICWKKDNHIFMLNNLSISSGVLML